MQRVVDQSEYVLAVLYHMRDQVCTNAKLYEPDADKRIAEAIAYTEEVLRSTRAQLKTWKPKQKVQAA